MPKITDQQLLILDFIRTEISSGGSAPTYREIANAFGFASPNAAFDHVRALEAKGYLRSRPRRSRGINLLVSSGIPDGETVAVPLLGRIPAGGPDERHQSGTTRLMVDRGVLGGKEDGRLFALRVDGDSMVGRGIFDGDIAVAEAGVSARDGDVVVALIDRQSTLKSLARRGGRHYLRAENPRYPDLIPYSDLAIQGVVRTVIRRMG